MDSNDDVGVKGHVIYNPQTFTSRLIASCKVHHIPEQVEVHEVLIDVKGPPTFTTENHRAKTSAQDLADSWLISKKQAELTLKNTTQKRFGFHRLCST